MRIFPVKRAVAFGLIVASVAGATPASTNKDTVGATEIVAPKSGELPTIMGIPYQPDAEAFVEVVQKVVATQPAARNASSAISGGDYTAGARKGKGKQPEIDPTKQLYIVDYGKALTIAPIEMLWGDVLMVGGKSFKVGDAFGMKVPFEFFFGEIPPPEPGVAAPSPPPISCVFRILQINPVDGRIRMRVEASEQFPPRAAILQYRITN